MARPPCSPPWAARLPGGPFCSHHIQMWGDRHRLRSRGRQHRRRAPSCGRRGRGVACGKVVLRKRTPMVQRRPPHACRVASSWAGRRPQSVSPGRPGLCALAGECTAVSRSGDELTPGVAELPRFVTRGSRGQCAPRGRAGRSVSAPWPSAAGVVSGCREQRPFSGAALSCFYSHFQF